MPFPMIHFSIAYRMFDGRPPSAFLLGSIAPDAVHLSDNKDAKAKSHLHDTRGTYPEWSGLLEFYNNRINTYEDKDYKWFLLGCLSHIIADHQWVIYKRELSDSDKSILKAIWVEEAQYDFYLNRTVPWRNAVENHVTSSPLYELYDIYTQDELDKWRQEIFIWLETIQNEPHIKNEYLQESYVESFIEGTAVHINKWMRTDIGLVFNEE